MLNAKRSARATALLSGLAAGVLLTAAPDASARTCHLQGQGQWGPIRTYTGPDDCDGVLAAGDNFVIDGDVEVVADILQAATPGARIEVSATGSLSASVADGPRQIQIGSGGLQCASGSTCDFAGGFRAPRSGPSIAAGDVVPGFPNAGFWSFGEPVPCPGWDASENLWQPDCAGALQSAGDIAGSDGTLGGHWAGPADAERVAALDAMQPGEVWYFSDDDLGDVEAGPESGFHYDLVGFAGTAAPGGPSGDYVHLDIVQGGSDNGYSHARRRIAACELAEPPVARTRQVFTHPGCIDVDFDRDGQWLRFERNGVAFAACPGSAAAPCEAESETTRIQASENDVPCPSGGTCDRFTLADVRGMERGRGAGGIVWISTAGPGAGDPAVVLVPVRFSSATTPLDAARESDSELTFLGATSLSGVVFDRTGGIRLSGYGFVPGAFEDVFVKSPTHDGQIALDFYSVYDITLRRVTLSGGDQYELGGTGGGGNDHGIALNALGLGIDFTLEDVSVRYTWDDFIVTSVELPPQSVSLRRVRTQFEGETTQSQSGFQIQNSVTEAWIEDFECIDCADSERPLTLAMADGAVRRVIFLSPKSDVGIALSGDVEDVTAIGALNHEGTSVVARRMTRCVVRENTSLSAAALASGSPLAYDRCLFQGNDVAYDLISAGSGSAQVTIRDSAFIDNLDSNANGNGDDVIDCRNVSGPGGQCVIERTTIAYTPEFQTDPSRYRLGVRGAAGNDGRIVEVEEAVFYGLNQAAYITSPEDADLERLCFSQNLVDMTLAQLVEVSDPAFEPLNLRDPDGGAFDPTPGGGADTHPCGIRRTPDSPGVCTRSWAHAVNRLEPECMAPSCSNGADDDFDGLRDYPEDPSCASPEDDSELSPACSDGVDNDGDGLVDLADPGCPNAASGPENPICDDGIDNDGDGKIDFADPDCLPNWPHREAGRSRCGLGAELVLILPLLGVVRRRRRAPRRT